jgi:hypothetical protein
MVKVLTAADRLGCPLRFMSINRSGQLMLPAAVKIFGLKKIKPHLKH